MGDKGGDGSDEAQRAPVSSRKGGEGFGYKDGSFRRVKESDTMRALSQLSNKDGRRSNANNLVLDDMNLDFDELDARVNEYPQVRGRRNGNSEARAREAEPSASPALR